LELTLDGELIKEGSKLFIKDMINYSNSRVIHDEVSFHNNEDDENFDLG
jgi:hypothetical protein